MRFACCALVAVSCVLCGAGTAVAEELKLPDAVHLPVPYMSQPDGETCLPTSLNMTLHWFGRMELTTDTVKALHKRTWYDRYNVPAIARDYGLYALPSWQELGWKKEDVKRQLAQGHPVIMGVNSGGRSGHFVLAVGYTADDRVIINDPTKRRADYSNGGPHNPVKWEDLMWRNGVMISPEPFGDFVRPVSGLVIATTAPVSLRPGQVAPYEVAVRNNGKEPWPYNTRLCAINPWGDGGWLKSKSDLFDPASWKSQSCAASVPETAPLVQPGETFVFKFDVRAPETTKSLTIHERFGLADGTGRWFFEDSMASPGPWRISNMIVVAPDTSDTLPIGAEPIPWKVKTDGAKVQDAKLPAGIQPPYEGAKVRYLPPGEDGFNSAWVGNNEWTDYRVEAWIWFDYDGDSYKTAGFDRVGIFARDLGMHSLVRKNLTEIDEALAIGFDGDDGQTRFGDCFNGCLGDGVGNSVPKEQRLYIKKSGWQKVAIECKGDEVKYYLGDQLMRTDKTGSMYPKGDCGVFKASYRTGEKRGLYFADFKVTPLK